MLRVTTLFRAYLTITAFASIDTNTSAPVTCANPATPTCLTFREQLRDVFMFPTYRASHQPAAFCGSCSQTLLVLFLAFAIIHNDSLIILEVFIFV